MNAVLVMSPDWLPQGASQAERWAVWTAAISGGLAGFLYITAKVRRGIRTLWGFAKDVRRRMNALEDLLNHELNPNSGTSLKDAVTRLDRAVADQSERLDTLEDHLGTLADSQRAIWPAIEAVAKAEPPKEGTS